MPARTIQSSTVIGFATHDSTHSVAGSVHKKLSDSCNFSRFLDEACDLSDAPPSIRLTASLRNDSSFSTTSHSFDDGGDALSLRSDGAPLQLPSPYVAIHNVSVVGRTTSKVTASPSRSFEEGGVNSCDQCVVSPRTEGNTNRHLNDKATTTIQQTFPSPPLQPREIETLLVHYFGAPK